jgi:murein DD-endopeptidase MepM/ murein hydrolase activator NlpD
VRQYGFADSAAAGLHELMTKTRIRALAFIVLLVSALPARAGADSSDDAKAKKAQLAAKLDALKADDAQLEAAVRTLDAGIVVQSSETASADQAASVADDAVDSAKVRLSATEKHAADLRQKASAVAVQAYVHPASDTFLEIMRARDLAEASRRQAFMAQVVNVDRDVLGQLRAVRQDQQAEQANLLVLRDQAEERRKQAADKLAELERLRSDQVRLRSALDVRIEEFTTEVEALNREEANIAALIKTREVTGASVDGNPVPAKSASGLIWPSDGPISSPFGFRWGALHAGIDIDSGYGAPIRAAKSGTVILAGWNGGYGNCTIIDHGGGFTTLYGHQSEMVVSEGAAVKQGQLIGYVGGTGNVTGPHLHFETRVSGTPQNPLNFLP